jgi:hypothetical protein
MWMFATLVLGPLAIAIHYWSSTAGAKPGNLILCASLFCVAAYSMAWVGSVWLLIRAGDEPNPLATLAALAVIPIVMGLMLVRIPLLRRLGLPRGRALRRGLLTEVMAWSLALTAFLSVSLYVDNRWLSTIPHPTSPYYGALASLAALGALILLVVLHWILDRRGFVVWAGNSREQRASAATIQLPTMRNSWWLLLVTLAVMIGGIALSASLFQ